MISAAAAAAASSAGVPLTERRRRLSTAALAVANQKVSSAYSPVVIAGLVRMVDLVLINLIGIALYFGYVARGNTPSWEYIAAIFAMSVSEKPRLISSATR